jgi:diguanylate cyclase (GGDEF)-like protein
MSAIQRPARVFVLALALGCALASNVSAQTNTSSSARWVAGSLEDRVDRLVREGYERPGPARTELDRLRTKPGLSPRENIVVLQGLAAVELQINRLAEARAIGDQMTVMARDANDPIGTAVARLVQGLIADTAGQMDEAAASAQAALGPLQQACTSGPVVDSDCDYRSTWRSLRLLGRRSMALGAVSMARAHEKAALAIAARAGDVHRQAVSLGTLAVLAQRSDEPAAVQPLLQQAFRLADASGDVALQARTRNDAATASDRSTSTGTSKADMLRYRQEALALARKAGEPRLEAQMLTNLSDAYMRLKQPAEALQAGQQALAIVRGLGEGAAEPAILINNIGIAKIGLGRIDAGKQDLADVLDIWKRRGDLRHQAESLREYGEALAAAGDAHTALQLYHQEREISARQAKANGEAALKELRLQNDAEAKQRSIELMARDNALKTEQLGNGELRQRIAWLVGALMCLSIGLVGLLYHRVREINRRLSASHDKLRMQSERDTLTGLANRRHVHATLQAMGTQREAGQGFEGTLLLVDVDHFKQVNDRIGHAAGDQVLVEMARRLTHATRRDDLVARWGGEEFLILVPKASAEQVEQLAARVLEAVSGTPIEAGGRLLHVTASIGYARFPLPPHTVPLSWEQAINLVDLALYVAKSEGRHRAIGVTGSSAASVQALQAVEADFDRARQDGRVTLVRAIGVGLPIAA